MTAEPLRKVLLLVASLFHFFMAWAILLYTYNGREVLLSEKLVVGIVIALFGFFLIFTGIQVLRDKLWAILTGLGILAISLFLMLAGIGWRGGFDALSSYEVLLLIAFFAGTILHGILGSMGVFKSIGR